VALKADISKRNRSGVKGPQQLGQVELDVPSLPYLSPASPKSFLLQCENALGEPLHLIGAGNIAQSYC